MGIGEINFVWNNWIVVISGHFSSIRNSHSNLIKLYFGVVGLSKQDNSMKFVLKYFICHLKCSVYEIIFSCFMFIFQKIWNVDTVCLINIAVGKIFILNGKKRFGCNQYQYHWGKEISIWCLLKLPTTCTAWGLTSVLLMVFRNV